MIPSKYETKTMLKHISFDCKCKFNSTTCRSNQNGIMIYVYAKVKRIISTEKIL